MTIDAYPAVDYARYQWPVDAFKLRAAGIRIAIIRLHNSGNPDERAVAHLQHAHDAGLKIVGYWYSHLRPGTVDANQAAVRDSLVALSICASAGVPVNTYMADVERGENPALDTIGLGPWAAQYLAALATGTWVYGGYDYITRLINVASIRARHPFVVARWPHGNEAVRIDPNEWAHALESWPKPSSAWDGWQFTSSGQVDGVPGRVDCDLIAGPLARSLWPDLGTPIPTPKENKVPADHVPAWKFEPIVSDCPCPTGGAWLLAQSGAVYAVGGAPYRGGVNGTPFALGNVATIRPWSTGYVITRADGVEYSIA